MEIKIIKVYSYNESWYNSMKKIIHLLLVCALGFLFVGCADNTSSSTDSNAKEDKPSEEFLDLLESFGMEDVDVKIQGEKNIIFAKKSNDITLEVLVFAGIGDIVDSYSDYIFVNVDGMTDTQKKSVEDTLDSIMQMYTDLSYCASEITDYSDTVKLLSLRFSNIDDEDKIQELMQLGALQLKEDSKTDSKISLQTSEKSLVDSGYIER